MSRGTAVVTGAAQGIGRAVSQRLAADGYDVLALDVNSDALSALATELGCRTAVVDVSDAEAVAGVADLAPEASVLVNNAAIQVYKDLLASTVDDMRAICDINVIGPVLMAQALVPVMASRGGGTIINLSSITSVAHAASTSLYPTSKAAINLLTQAMAVEFADKGIRCNAVAPGTVLTEGTAGHYGTEQAQQAIGHSLLVGRMGRPSDIADAIAFLCSDEAAWITGQVLFVDGGFTASQGQYFRAARKMAMQS